jgi:O-antigen/teichoic acid export membrane protein
MVAGAFIEFRLPVILSRAMYGSYGVVSSHRVASSTTSMVTGSIQAVSRFTAQKPETARAVEAAGLRMHLRLGLPTALVFIAAAPVVGWAMGDTAKIGPIMLAGVIVATYAFYAVLVGTANGLRQFNKQAGLDITSATLRAIGILGFTAVGLGVYGAYGGWVAAAGWSLLATVVIGLPPASARGPEARALVKPMAKYFARVAVYLILLNLILFVDQILLKVLTAGWYREHGPSLAPRLDRACPGRATSPASRSIPTRCPTSRSRTTARSRTWRACRTRRSSPPPS